MFLFLAGYMVMYTITPSGKWNGLRRKLAIAVWNKPVDCLIKYSYDINLEKWNQFVSKLP